MSSQTTELVSREPSRSQRFGVEVLLWVGALLLIAPLVWASVYQPDELNALYDAKRIAGGEVMYRDFFEFVAPLSYWLNAGLFKLGGAHLWVARLSLGGVMAASARLLYALARCLGAGPWSGLVSPLILLACLFQRDPLWLHHWIALPFALGALLAILKERRWSWSVAGLLLGGLVLVTQTDGVVAIAMLAGGGVWVRAVDRQRPLAVIRPAFELLAGASLPVILAVLVLGVQGALPAAWADVMTWPAAHYHKAGGFNDTFYGAELSPLTATNTPDWTGRLPWALGVFNVLMLLVIPLGVGSFGLAWLLEVGLRAWRERTSLRAAERGHSLVLCLTLGYILLACWGRADVIHVSFYAAPAMLLAVSVAARAWQARSALPYMTVRALPMALLMLYVASGLAASIKNMRRFPEHYMSVATPDARLMASPLVQYLSTHAHSGDRMVGLPLGGFDYFFGLPSATRMHVLMPRSAHYNDEADYQGYAADLRANQPRYVVINPDHPVLAEALAELPYPLTGYKLVAKLSMPLATGDSLAFVFERAPRCNR